MRREDGFTLIELLVVVAIVGVLLALAFGFQNGARERAGNATAQTNIRSAVPAIEAYRADNGTYLGMSEATLKSQYNPGLSGIVVLSTAANTYCVRATEGGSTWYKLGPDGQLSQAPCS